MPQSDADRLDDEEDRFYGHLATYSVTALMALLLGIAGGPASWLVALFAAWGVVLACHAVRVRAACSGGEHAVVAREPAHDV
jgi:hypothetical protein